MRDGQTVAYSPFFDIISDQVGASDESSDVDDLAPWLHWPREPPDTGFRGFEEETWIDMDTLESSLPYLPYLARVPAQ